MTDQTSTCRTCGADVEITTDPYDEFALPQQTDTSGHIVCDACWDADPAATAAHNASV